jgi:hypothetical protein
MRWNAPEDFQSYSPGRVSARNCLMWNTRFPTASCAGVCWNDQEGAGVGHNLGTTSATNINGSGRLACGLLPGDIIAQTRAPVGPGALGTADGQIPPRLATPEGDGVGCGEMAKRPLSRFVRLRRRLC